MSVVTQPMDRTDGPLKVTGQARYAAEFQLPRLAHAVIVQSTIAKGSIVSLDASAAQKVPGVVLVLWHLNAPKLPQGGKAAIKPPAGRTLSLLQDNVVHYNGQPIAVVVADSFEHAVAGTDLVRGAGETGGAIRAGSARARGQLELVGAILERERQATHGDGAVERDRHLDASGPGVAADVRPREHYA